MLAARERCRTAGEGHGHTTRVHVSEESDSGILPMNHSNKDGKPLAESEEGRPLIKENTRQPNTYPTQSEKPLVVRNCDRLSPRLYWNAQTRHDHQHAHR